MLNVAYFRDLLNKVLIILNKILIQYFTNKSGICVSSFKLAYEKIFDVYFIKILFRAYSRLRYCQCILLGLGILMKEEAI